MSESQQPQDDILILVDFGDGYMRDVANGDEPDPKELEDLDDRSRKAVDTALKTVRWVAAKSKAAIDAMVDQPDEVELEFGIQIGTKAGVLVMQGTADFHIKARLVYKKGGSNGATH